MLPLPSFFQDSAVTALLRYPRAKTPEEAQSFARAEESRKLLYAEPEPEPELEPELEEPVALEVFFEAGESDGSRLEKLCAKAIELQVNGTAFRSRFHHLSSLYDSAFHCGAAAARRAGQPGRRQNAGQD